MKEQPCFNLYFHLPSSATFLCSDENLETLEYVSVQTITLKMSKI